MTAAGFFSPLFIYPFPDSDTKAHSPAWAGSYSHGGAPQHTRKTKHEKGQDKKTALRALEGAHFAGPPISGGGASRGFLEGNE